MEHFSNYRHTDFIHLDIDKCIACWKCVDNCPEVIGKTIHPSPMHVRIDYPDRCIGCLQCIRICTAGAFTPVIKQQ